MAILTPKMRTTFSSMFDRLRETSSPFYKLDASGERMQGWMIFNLITRHVSIRFTSRSHESSDPVVIRKQGLAGIPIPFNITGRQMHKALTAKNDAEGYSKLKTTLKEKVEVVFKHQATQGDNGTVVISDEKNLPSDLHQIARYLEDISSATNVIAAKDLTLADMGLLALGDDNKYHKSMADVTKVMVKATGQLLISRQQIVDQIEWCEKQLSGQGMPVVVLGLTEVLNDLMVMTLAKMDPFISNLELRFSNAEHVMDSHRPVEITKISIEGVKCLISMAHARLSKASESRADRLENEKTSDKQELYSTESRTSAQAVAPADPEAKVSQLMGCQHDNRTIFSNSDNLLYNRCFNYSERHCLTGMSQIEDSVKSKINEAEIFYVPGIGSSIVFNHNKLTNSISNASGLRLLALKGPKLSRPDLAFFWRSEHMSWRGFSKTWRMLRGPPCTDKVNLTEPFFVIINYNMIEDLL